MTIKWWSEVDWLLCPLQSLYSGESLCRLYFLLPLVSILSAWLLLMNTFYFIYMLSIILWFSSWLLFGVWRGRFGHRHPFMFSLWVPVNVVMLNLSIREIHHQALQTLSVLCSGDHLVLVIYESCYEFSYNQSIKGNWGNFCGECSERVNI